MTRGNIVTNSRVYYGSMRDTAAMGLLAEINELYIESVYEAKASVHIVIPSDMDKSRLYAMKNHVPKALKRMEKEGYYLEEVQVTGEICGAIRVPETVITVSGEMYWRERLSEELLPTEPGKDIVIVGWVGAEGMVRILGEKEQELRARFAPSFIQQIKGYSKEICGLPKLKAIKKKRGALTMQQIGRGGVLAALWKLTEKGEWGLEADLKKIPLLQETIEVCEHFRLNPYQMTSSGCFLLTSNRGEEMVRALREQNIPAVVIGQLVKGNDKIIRNGEEVRYLDRPMPDEMMRIFRL